MHAGQAVPGVGPVVCSVQSVLRSIMVLEDIALTTLSDIFHDLVACVHRNVLGPCSKMRFDFLHVEV